MADEFKQFAVIMNLLVAEKLPDNKQEEAKRLSTEMLQYSVKHLAIEGNHELAFQVGMDAIKGLRLLHGAESKEYMDSVSTLRDNMNLLFAEQLPADKREHAKSLSMKMLQYSVENLAIEGDHELALQVGTDAINGLGQLYGAESKEYTNSVRTLTAKLQEILQHSVLHLFTEEGKHALAFRMSNYAIHGLKVLYGRPSDAEMYYNVNKEMAERELKDKFEEEQTADEMSTAHMAFAHALTYASSKFKDKDKFEDKDRAVWLYFIGRRLELAGHRDAAKETYLTAKQALPSLTTDCVRRLGVLAYEAEEWTEAIEYLRAGRPGHVTFGAFNSTLANCLFAVNAAAIKQRRVNWPTVRVKYKEAAELYNQQVAMHTTGEATAFQNDLALRTKAAFLEQLRSLPRAADPKYLKWKEATLADAEEKHGEGGGVRDEAAAQEAAAAAERAQAALQTLLDDEGEAAPVSAAPVSAARAKKRAKNKAKKKKAAAGGAASTGGDDRKGLAAEEKTAEQAVLEPVVPAFAAAPAPSAHARDELAEAKARIAELEEANARLHQDLEASQAKVGEFRTLYDREELKSRQLRKEVDMLTATVADIKKKGIMADTISDTVYTDAFPDGQSELATEALANELISRAKDSGGSEDIGIKVDGEGRLQLYIGTPQMPTWFAAGISDFFHMSLHMTGLVNSWHFARSGHGQLARYKMSAEKTAYWYFPVQEVQHGDRVVQHKNLKTLYGHTQDGTRAVTLKGATLQMTAPELQAMLDLLTSRDSAQLAALAVTAGIRLQPARVPLVF